MNDKISGLVLSNSDYRDNDTILQVLTKDYGILSIVTRGSKKINSKNRFLNMCLYEFLIDYKEGKTIYTLKNGKLIKSYYEDKDIDLITYKNIFLEACLKSKEMISSDYYDYLIFILDNMNDKNKYLLGSLFMNFLCDEFGISPYVDGCVICDIKKVVNISNDKGGFTCESHTNNQESIEIDRLKKFRLLVKGGFENYEILKEYDYDKEDFNIITNFFIDNSDINLKAYKFYQKI